MFLKKLILLIIKVYQIIISPFFPPACRFYPTCSQYAIDAVTRYGIFYGIYLAAKRILKCHPFHPGGYEPVT